MTATEDPPRRRTSSPSPSTASRSRSPRARCSSARPSSWASRSRASATTRCSSRPALVASACRGHRHGQRPRHAEAGGVVHDDRDAGHGGQDPADLGRGRQGAAGRHGDAADQPPARLPGLRQGRRVPAAEPGDEQRPRRLALPRSQAHLPEADRDLVERPARSRALRAVPALHPLLRADRRRSVHRPARARSAAADRHLERGPVPVLLLGQHRADLPGRRADRCVLPVPRPPVRPDVHRLGVRALLVRLRTALRLAARQDHPAAGRRGSRGQRGVELRQGPLGVPLRDAAGPAARPRSFATTPAASSRRAGRTHSRGQLRACARLSTAAGSACFRVAGSPKRTRTPTPSSPASRWARTTSTTGRVRRSDEELDFLASHVAGTTPQHVSYESLETAPAVLLVGFEPEEESPIVFLRMHKSTRIGRMAVWSIAPLASTRVGEARRNADPGAAGRRGGGVERTGPAVTQALRRRGRADPRRRAAGDVDRCVERSRPPWPRATGAALAWVPRRAGERGAIDSGALPNLLPGARAVADAAARGEVERVWGGSVPEQRPAATSTRS